MGGVYIMNYENYVSSVTVKDSPKILATDIQYQPFESAR